MFPFFRIDILSVHHRTLLIRLLTHDDILKEFLFPPFGRGLAPARSLLTLFQLPVAAVQRVGLLSRKSIHRAHILSHRDDEKFPFLHPPPPFFCWMRLWELLFSLGQQQRAEVDQEGNISLSFNFSKDDTYQALLFGYSTKKLELFNMI